MVKFKKNHQTSKKPSTKDEIEITNIKLAAFWLTVGLLGLLVSAEITVWGAKSIASYFNVSDLIMDIFERPQFVYLLSQHILKFSLATPVYEGLNVGSIK